MKTYIWIVPTLQCLNCGALKEGARIILAEEDDGMVVYKVLCSNCDTLIVGELSQALFWELMNGVPPNETGN